MHVVAPASSANLGPGFDCLALALDLPFELVVGDLAQDVPGDGWLTAEPTHPAAAAFAAAGGDPSATLRWRSPIPPGRGLGFSGAARVAGAFAATGSPRDAAAVAGELEGHAENAAASAFGGFVVAAGGATVGVPFPEGPAVVVWWPTSSSTSTDASRRRLPAEVPLADATFSVGRAALWVAAVAAGDLTLLRTATDDRLHQPSRLAGGGATAAVLAAWRDDRRVLGAWLSGSGPTVAALVADTAAGEALGQAAATVAAGEGSEGSRWRVLDVDRRGVRHVGPTAGRPHH